MPVIIRSVSEKKITENLLYLNSPQKRKKNDISVLSKLIILMQNKKERKKEIVIYVT